MPLYSRPESNRELVEQVKSILASRRLTLYEVSQRSLTLFGRQSSHYIPHNLYYDLRRETFSPSLFQLFALSQISGYRLTDWMGVFKFEAEWIPRLQIQLPSKRTILVDSSLDDPNALIPWLRDLPIRAPSPGMVPLSQVLEWTKPKRLGSLQKQPAKDFLYAKIGQEDALAFPELLAGSIVRVRLTGSDDILTHLSGEGPGKLVLMEHRKGLCCCRIRRVRKGRVGLVSTLLPYAEIEFRVPEEVRLIGLVDLEIRSLLEPRQAVLHHEFERRWMSQALPPRPSQLGPLLRQARVRAGLSFRAASALSRQIADLLRDERYFIAPSSLSDYEAVNTPPRHFHKIATFCTAYGLRFDSVLAVLGLRLEQAGHEAMPDALVGRIFAETNEPRSVLEHARQNGFLADLVAEFQEIPFFLRDSLKTLCGLARPSLKDFFRLARGHNMFHPYMQGALLAIVNRRRKRPNNCQKKPLWQQPLSVLLKRDGTYLCGCCSRDDHNLIVHSYAGGICRREQFRNRDVEVIGRIVLVARRLI